MTYDFIIIGAGIAGASAACVLVSLLLFKELPLLCFDAGFADGLARGIGESVEPAPPGAFAHAYRDGLVEGWNGAIEAARQAVFDKGLDSSSTEINVLDAMERR